MHTRPGETQARCERTLRSRLVPLEHRVICPLTVRELIVDDPQGEPAPAEQILHTLDARPWRPIALGTPWGPAWGTTWFELTGTVPPAERDNHDLELLIDLGWQDHSPGFQAEAIVYRPEGAIVKALNPRNTWIPLCRADGTPDFAADGTFRLLLEAAANPLMLDVPPFEVNLLGEKATAGNRPLYTFARADLTARNPAAAELSIDLRVASELAAIVPEADPRHARLLAAIDDALDAFDDQDPASIAAARAVLAPALASPANASAHHLWATGHAHIDSAWLWPIRETVRKVARTVSNQLCLIDRYPQHVFSMSSAQQYAWLEERYPQLFDRLRERVADGHIVPVGGMWVEPDAVLPSSESMVRQFTFGKRYFIDRFGMEPREVWLPDTFGYSGALPQLARLAGFDFFLTQKISWSDTNKFPHHTFWWEGIDGSRIFTHFPPADTYNGQLTGEELGHAVANFQDKARSSHSLVPFGYGDGGGGPTREMLARASRWADIEGAPKVTLATANEFFTAALAEYPDAPVWKGELYLELHRGTPTSQHQTKRGNRRCEALLLQAERAAAAATIAASAEYPYQELESAWRAVLLHQFHDILPGSSIGWVHREAAQTYAELENRLRAIVARAHDALRGAGIDPSTHQEPTPQPVTVACAEGRGWLLTNGRCRAVIDDAGEITSLRWQDGSEMVAPGAALGRLELLIDQPTTWDAWDVDTSAMRRPVTAARPSPRIETIWDAHHSGLRIAQGIGSASTVVTEVTLAAGSQALQLRYAIDWHESERMLKIALPFDLDTDHAEFETQFGYLTRDITDNTSWQWAQHEVSTHRFVRLTQGSRSVAVLNDSSYGLSLSRDRRADGGSHVTVHPSLLRAPRFPDPTCDQGHQEMAFALAPAPAPEDAVRAAREFNRVGPPAQYAGVLPELSAGTTALIEAVKLADDRSGDVIVRMYEAAGAPTTAVLTVPTGLVEPQVADLLERPVDAHATMPTAQAGINPGSYAFELRGFQILTVRLRRRA